MKETIVLFYGISIFPHFYCYRQGEITGYDFIWKCLKSCLRNKMDEIIVQSFIVSTFAAKSITTSLFYKTINIYILFMKYFYIQERHEKK